MRHIQLTQIINVTRNKHDTHFPIQIFNFLGGIFFQLAATDVSPHQKKLRWMEFVRINESQYTLEKVNRECGSLLFHKPQWRQLT